jgi:hypothetical protein
VHGIPAVDYMAAITPLRNVAGWQSKGFMMPSEHCSIERP